MNEDNIKYKGVEKREDGDFHVYSVNMNNDEETNFHVPSGFLSEKDGESQLLYAIYLSIETPDLLKEHILTVLDGHAENWMKTAFSGDVYLKCWNDMLEPEHLEPVGDVLSQVVAGAQQIIDSNNITSADGNRIVLRATLGKFVLTPDSHQVPAAMTVTNSTPCTTLAPGQA